MDMWSRRSLSFCAYSYFLIACLALKVPIFLRIRHIEAAPTNASKILHKSLLAGHSGPTDELSLLGNSTKQHELMTSPVPIGLTAVSYYAHQCAGNTCSVSTALAWTRLPRAYHTVWKYGRRAASRHATHVTSARNNGHLSTAWQHWFKTFLLFLTCVMLHIHPHSNGVFCSQWFGRWYAVPGRAL